jgi:DNA-binding GntR family transcriptional regulator
MLLKQRVHSTEALELLLLSRHATRVRSVAELAEECGVPEMTAREALEQLAASGLADANAERSHFGYRRDSAEAAAAVEELVRLYDVDRSALLKLMSENAIERIRGAMARVFADAFLLDSGRVKGGGNG